LALVAQADLDVIAALAHAGKINSALGQIAMNAFSGELPPLNSTRVRTAPGQIVAKSSGGSAEPALLA
jgi:hypothetical protein